MGAMNENIFYSNTNIHPFEEESSIEQDNSSYHLVPEPEPIQKKKSQKLKTSKTPRQESSPIPKKNLY